jgi:threonine/homoserine/homoserine lactone efflux protein
MSIAMLLVPGHVALPRFVAPSAGSHAPVAGGLMVWLTLAAWAVSALVLILPALRERAREGSYHVVCSASMIAAMIAMASASG